MLCLLIYDTPLKISLLYILVISLNVKNPDSVNSQQKSFLFKIAAQTV